MFHAQASTSPGIRSLAGAAESRRLFAPIVLIAVAIAAAFAVFCAQPAWAAGETAVDVGYAFQMQGGYQGLDESSAFDNRDELRVEVDFGKTLLEDEAGTLYVKADFYLRPADATDASQDVFVYSGSVLNDYGTAHIERSDYLNGVEKTSIIASFLIPQVKPGTYRLVLDASAVRRYTNEKDTITDADWTAPERYVAKPDQTLTVVCGSDPRPTLKKATLPTAAVGTAYYAKLNGAPSDMSHTLTWTSVNSMNWSPLDNWGLTLNQDGSITGTVQQAYDFLPWCLPFSVTVTEMDGSTVVGATTRTFNIFMTEELAIDSADPGFSRSIGGIVANSKMILQMWLTAATNANGSAVVYYEKVGGGEASQTYKLTRAAEGSLVYTDDGAAYVPSDAARITKVSFALDNNSVDDLVVELDSDEGVVAPTLAVSVDGSLGEGLVAPYLSVFEADSDYEYDALWFEVDEGGAIENLVTSDLPAGTYDIALGAYADGAPCQVSDAVSVTLEEGTVTDLTGEPFMLGSFKLVEPSVTAPDGAMYTLGWYADAACSKQLATSAQHGWVNTQTMYVRALLPGRALFDFVPSDPVRITDANAGSLSLSISERPTCTVSGRVVRKDAQSNFALSDLRVSLTLDAAEHGVRTYTAKPDAVGNFQIQDVPTGMEADAKLVISGERINTAESAPDLSGASAQGANNIGDVQVSAREGVIALAAPVSHADVLTAGGDVLASTLSSGGMYIFLDDPSQVSAGDVLTCKLYQGSSRTLYDGGVYAHCQTTTDALDSAKCATVSSQEMERTGGLTVDIANDHKKLFGAVLVKADSSAIVRTDLGDEHSNIGTPEERFTYTFSSVPAGSYVVVLGERDALAQLDSGDWASLGYLEDALSARGTDMYVKSGTVTVSAGEQSDVSLSFPDSNPYEAPISTDDSSLTMSEQGSNLYYRMLIAQGTTAIPADQDLNIIVSTSQTGNETQTRSGDITGSVVYINGKAARAKSVMGGDDGEGEVYLLPNSMRNSFSSSNGLFIITIPAADLASGAYGDFPLAVSFSAPRLNGSSMTASASVAFGNYDWGDYHHDANTFMRGMRHSTRYSIGSSSLAKAAITCYAPANVVTTDFTVYGMAPLGEDVAGDVEVYLDGTKATAVAPSTGTGLYSVKLSLNDPFERSKHSVVAKVKLADGTTISSTASQVIFDPNMAALSRIETSTYNGNYTTSWEDGEAFSGYWYYLPNVPTKYRLTFRKGTGLAEEGDVTDVYVNVPRGTETARLKATFAGNGTWETEAYPMGNTPPTGEWVSYRPAVSKAEVSQGDAAKLETLLEDNGANENGFLAPGTSASDYTLTTDSGDVFFSVSEDGSVATFEGVRVTSTASEADQAEAREWVAALPADPWANLPANATQAQKDELDDAGYVGHWQLQSTDGSLLEEDVLGDTGASVEYASAAGESNTIYQRVGVLDASWNALPDMFDPAGADAGKAASDSITVYPYADGSGAIYERLTVTRDRFVQGICDTKTGRIYELANDATSKVTADRYDTTKDKTEWIIDQTIAIANGWGGYYADLVGATQGIKPADPEQSGLVTGGMTGQSSGSSSLSLQALTLEPQIWPFSKEISDYDKASASDTQRALMDWVTKNKMSGFDDFTNIDFNPGDTQMGSVSNRIKLGWGSLTYKELMKTVAQSCFSTAGGKVMDIVGLDFLAQQAVQKSAVGAKGAYEYITPNNARDYYVACLRAEAYRAALMYKETHPNDSHFTLDGFPFGTSLPDPRNKDEDSDDPDGDDDNAKEQEEGRDNDNEKWPDGDGSKNDGEPQNADGNTSQVPIPPTQKPVIDPSGYVYAGVEENRIEGVTATLFEVADDGSCALWGASEYGQVNPYITDENGAYEWFVPEGKWSVTFTKSGYRPYTTGASDGIGSAQTAGPGYTWYMPVAPAQLDVNINMAPIAAPAVDSVELTDAGIEIMFTQIMDESTIEDAISFARNGTPYGFSVTCSNEAVGDGYATKATVVPGSSPRANDLYTLSVGIGASNYAGVGMQASYPASIVVPDDEGGSGGEGGEGGEGGQGGGSGGGSGGGNTVISTVKVGNTYTIGSGKKAAIYVVKTVATAQAAGSVWYVKPAQPKKITSVSVPATVLIEGKAYVVTGIASKAFAKCPKLKKATIGKSVKTVKSKVFSGCKKLKTITVKSGTLTKKSCKNLVAGSKVKTVKLSGAAKKAKKTYKKFFPKRVKVK